MRNPSKVYEFVYSRILSELEGDNWQESLNRYLYDKINDYYGKSKI